MSSDVIFHIFDQKPTLARVRWQKKIFSYSNKGRCNSKGCSQRTLFLFSPWKTLAVNCHLSFVMTTGVCRQQSKVWCLLPLQGNSIFQVRSNVAAFWQNTQNPSKSWTSVNFFLNFVPNKNSRVVQYSVQLQLFLCWMGGWSQAASCQLHWSKRWPRSTIGWSRGHNLRVLAGSFVRTAVRQSYYLCV